MGCTLNDIYGFAIFDLENLAEGNRKYSIGT
jgi:hypothetical protein